MSALKIGIIGYNEGNGHPFSFSAIINGFNKEAFHLCPYPVINSYLSERKREDFGIGTFRVSHVWTPFQDITEGIAAYANIENTVAHYREMIGNVDAVIIARDDAETHREIAEPFLAAGIKIFIDKPLCKTSEDLEYFKPFLLSGQLMSCSGLRFFPDIQNRFQGRLVEKDVLFCHCVAPLDWFKYGIHVLESVIPILGSDIQWVQNVGESGNDIVRVQFGSGKYALIQVCSSLGGGLRTTIFGKEQPPFYIHFNDNFSCFRQQLIHFYEFVTTGRMEIKGHETINIIRALIASHDSRGNQKRINIHG